MRSIYLSHSKLLFVCILYKTSYLLENKDKTNMSKNVKFWLDFGQNLQKKVTFFEKRERVESQLIYVSSTFITTKDHM